MRHIFDYIKKNKILLWVIIPAFIFHLLIIFPSGSYYCFKTKCGLFFWGAHSHDGLWHLALSAKAFTTIPFNMPVFQGRNLAGYNYLFDLLVFITSRFGFSNLFLYFKVFPIVWFLLITVAAIKLAQKINKSALFSAIFLFFIFFGGSFGYILSLLNNRTILGSSSLLAMQSGHTLINPPYAVSLITLLLVLQFILGKKHSMKNYLLTGVLCLLTLGLKFYGGVIAFFIVSLHYFLDLFLKKEFKQFFISSGLLVGFFILGLLIFYNPTGTTGGPVFKLYPLATVHPFIEEKNLLYRPDTVNARYFLLEHGVGPRLIAIEFFTLLAFLIFNFGVRIFGFLDLAVRLFRRKLSQFDLEIFGGILIGIMLSVLLVQKGQWWNSIQFIYYSIFLSNILIARFVFNLFKKKNLITLALGILILVMTIPINLDLIFEFTRWPAPTFIANDEIQALQFLKKQKDGIVLTSPFDKTLPERSLEDPTPVYAQDSAYVTAISQKQVYIADTAQLEISGIEFKKRIQEIKNGDCSILKITDYMYEVKRVPLIRSFGKCGYNFKKIFQNNLVNIYKKKS